MSFIGYNSTGYSELAAEIRTRKSRLLDILNSFPEVENAISDSWKGADATAYKDELNKVMPIPIEVYPEAVSSVREALLDLGATESVLRKAEKKDGPVFTENNNVILDTKFTEIYETLEEDIKSITGVIESGLFMEYPIEVIH